MNGLVVQQARALGWGPDKPIYCSPSAGHPGFLARAGKDAEGVHLAAPWLLVHREAPRRGRVGHGADRLEDTDDTTGARNRRLDA